MKNIMNTLFLPEVSVTVPGYRSTLSSDYIYKTSYLLQQGKSEKTKTKQQQRTCEIQGFAMSQKYLLLLLNRNIPKRKVLMSLCNWPTFHMYVFPAQFPGSNSRILLLKQRAGPEIISLIPRLAIIKNDTVCDICNEITRKWVKKYN